MVYPHITVNVPKPTVNVPIPTINVPRPIVMPTVNVPKPVVMPTVNVPRPTINVPRPTINVPRPTINVPIPTVNVPRTVVTPTINVPRTVVMPTINVPIPTVNVPRPVVTPTINVPKPIVPPTINVPKPTVNVLRPPINVPNPFIPPPINFPIPTINVLRPPINVPNPFIPPINGPNPFIPPPINGPNPFIPPPINFPRPVVTPTINVPNQFITQIPEKRVLLTNNICKRVEWRKFNNNNEACMKVKEVSNNLRERFVNDIIEGQNKGQQVVLIYHKGDAVKNITRDQEEANRIYNVLPENWYELTYGQRAEIMRNIPEGIDFKRWSRQQWPYNSIRYAQNIEAKVIYIQCDYNYCSYPSIFAEAMCGVLYNNLERIDDLYYNLTGPNHSLYCVGDYAVGDRLFDIARHFDVPNITSRDDVEWANMSNSFLNDFYRLKIAGQSPDNIANSYIFFPWDIIYNNRNNPVAPVNITIRRLNGISTTVNNPDGTVTRQNFPQQYNTALTYLTEIPHIDMEKYSTGERLLKNSWVIPLSWLYPTNQVKQIFATLSLGVVADLYIKNSITFDGTYDNPRFILDNVDITNEVFNNYRQLRLLNAPNK